MKKLGWDTSNEYQLDQNFEKPHWKKSSVGWNKPKRFTNKQNGNLSIFINQRLISSSKLMRIIRIVKTPDRFKERKCRFFSFWIDRSWEIVLEQMTTADLIKAAKGNQMKISLNAYGESIALFIDSRCSLSSIVHADSTTPNFQSVFCLHAIYLK